MHSASVGLGLNDFNNTKLTWALINWKLKLIKLCRYGDTLTVKTWARNACRIYSYRDFEVYDSNNNLLAIATSKWVLIDITKNGMIKIEKDIIRKILSRGKKCF